MRKNQIFLNEGNRQNKNTIRKLSKDNLDKKVKEKILKEILELVNQNMDNMNTNLNNAKESINNELNANEKELFMNYNGESISILSDSISDNIMSDNRDGNLNDKGNETNIRKVLIYENIDVNKNLKNKGINSNENDLLNEFNNSNRNLPLYDSNSISNTCKKKMNNIPIINYKNMKLSPEPESENNETNTNRSLNDFKMREFQIIKFFSEINLPSVYATKFIENGFDNLNILIKMTKNGIAINNQNLIDIGIYNAGDRAKILIHLEEKAKIFPIECEKHIIYNNSYNCKSLEIFLAEYNCQQFVNNFKMNGYYNIELLYCQMLTREPINRNNIINDFGIKEEYYIDNILKGLADKSNIYLNKLKKKNCSFEGKKEYKNSCDFCFIV